jgi:hypothetical protein
MKKSELDLDSILDQALDDFEEIEYAENAKKVLNLLHWLQGRIDIVWYSYFTIYSRMVT